MIIAPSLLCILQAPATSTGAGPNGCLPRKSLFGKALFGLLTTCAADPTLAGRPKSVWGTGGKNRAF